MKKYLLTWMLVILFTGFTFAQLTGSYTIPGVPYATIASAVTALNTSGVGAGGVTFNVTAGYTETISARLDLTATGTAANPIIFQKTGAGADPLITAYTGTALPGAIIPDGIWSLTGSDYVTIDGIDLVDPAANTTPTTTMEYGYGLFKASGTDGANNNTIKNCTITLNRNNNSTVAAGPFFQGSNGIVVMDCSPTAATTYTTVTDVTGASSNNKFYHNTIQNVNCCISMTGYTALSPYTLADVNNDIGGNSLATGNSLINFGGGAAATNPASGVFIKDQWGFNVSYNTVINNNGSGINHITTNRGIWANASSNGASGTINNNTVTMQGGGTTTQISAIESSAGSTGGGNTITINNNTITNCTNATNTSGIWYGIWNNAASATNLNIQNNVFSSNLTNTTTGTMYLIYNNGACPGTINLTGNQLSQAFQGATAYSGTLYCIYNASGTVATTTNINNNNFSNLTYVTTATGSVYFIYNSNSNSNLSISNNTWTNLTLNHSGGNYLMYNASNTQVALTVSNNSIVTGYTRTAAAGAMYIYYAGSSSLPGSTQTFTGNTFSNITAATAGAGTFYGFYNSDGATSPYPTKNLTNNTISNVTYNSTGTMYGFYTTYLGDNTNFSGNTFSNITFTGTIYGLYPGSIVSPSIRPNFFNNTVNNITSNGAASVIYTCYIGSAGAGLNFYRNNVYNITETGATGVAYGMYVSSAIPANIYNNYISDIKAPNTTNAIGVAGLYIGGGTTINFYDNTIYLNASSTGATFGSAGIYASITPAVDLRNNIVVNVSTPGATGLTVAYRRSSTTLTTYAATSNNNDFYAGTPGASNLIYYDVTNSDQTLIAYKSRVSPRDAQSVTELPPFTSIVAPPYNLHINTTVATQCESGGTVVSSPYSITTDYDNDARFPNVGYPNNVSYNATAPDIGADEFGGLLLDLTPPGMSFTPLPNTSSLVARALTTTITDQTGVPVSGTGLPRLYWKKFYAGTWNNVQGVYVSGNTYTFTFGAGVVLNDSIYYYLVAQDMVAPTPNIGANPSTGASGYSANPPAVSTPPTTLYAYKIVPSLCGTINVGAGQTYTSLTAAVAALNASEVTCPVTFLLTDAAYGASETFPIVINNPAGGSATNTITIKPAPGMTPTISGSSASALIKFNGASYITIDGSNSGGSDRSLTFSNTVASGTTAVIWVGSTGTGNGSNFVTIKNCNISNGYLASAAYGIFAGSAASIGTQGNDNDNLTIQNNSISKAYYGIWAQATATGVLDNLVITGNSVGSSTAASYIGHDGIMVANATGAVISQNTVFNIITTNTTPAGMTISTGVTNSVISRNNINNITYTSTGGYGGRGMYINSGSATCNLTISNNVIGVISGDGYTSFSNSSPVGMYFDGTNGGLNIYHNSVYMSGNITFAGATLTTAILFYTATNTNIDLRNNIFQNSINNTGSATGKSYAIYSVAPAASFTQINFNDYYVTGIQGILGYLGGDILTLAAWKIATGKDGSSINVDPVFTSTTNLLPTTVLMNNAGTYIATVTDDFNGTLRSNPPDMGAFEFAIDPLINTTAASAITQSTATLNGTINANNFTVNSFFDYGLTTAYGSSVSGVPASVTGTTVTNISGAIAGLTPATLYHFRARGVATPSGLIAYGPDMTFTTAAAPPTVVTTAATAITSSGATLNGTVNPNNAPTTVTFQYGLTIAYGSTVTAVQSPVSGTTVVNVNAPVTGLAPATLYHYRVVGTNSGGTSNGNDLTFTTSAIPPVVATNPASNISVSTAQLNGTVTANNSSTTVSFDWGLTIAYGNNVAGIPSPVTGNSPTAVSATIGGLTSGLTYHFRCNGTNSGGTTNGTDQSFVAGCQMPGPAGSIAGPPSVCANATNVIYSVGAILNALTYTWSVPAGASIVSGQGTQSIIVNMGTNSGSVTVYGANGCGNGTPSSMAVTVNALPTPTISGNNTVCQGSTGNGYTTQAGMTNYSWIVSAGGTIVSGAGTYAIDVTWNTPGPQSVSVNYNNAAGCTAAVPTVFNVIVNAAPTPTISGPTTMCVNSGFYTYSTQTGLFNYSWSVSTGGSITYGQGTSSIQVNWTGVGTQSVSVSCSNAAGCYPATPPSLSITVTPVPGDAGTITGVSSVCGGAANVAYSVGAIANATSYVWNLPPGATIASGAGTNSITVNFAANASSGNITVYGNNLCGNGNASPPFPVTVTALPADPGTITGQASVCQGTTGVIYSVPPIANATSYNWSVPTGATIVSGSTTNTITVDFSASASSGVVSVFGTNSCGDGAASNLNVTLNPVPAAPVITNTGSDLSSNAPAGNQWYFSDDNIAGTAIPGATGQNYSSTKTGWYWDEVTLNGCESGESNHIFILFIGVGSVSGPGVSIYPVPNDGRFSIGITTASPDNYSITVLNNLGVTVREVKDVNVTSYTDMVIDLRPAPSGVYTVIIQNSLNRVVKKIMINK